MQIDGLASVHSIERFLCQKGIIQTENQTAAQGSAEGETAVGMEERKGRRNIGVQIMIGNTPLPSDWSVLQVGNRRVTDQSFMTFPAIICFQNGVSARD